MPCSKCQSDFNILNWKIKCAECSEKYCTKCLQRNDGVLYCEKCTVLITRPPDKSKLMTLKPKDIQDYLRKHKISTHGLVEKRELVDVLCESCIPVHQRQGADKFTANFAGSMPNLRSPTLFNDLRSGIESAFHFNSSNTSPQRPVPPLRPEPTQPSTSWHQPSSNPPPVERPSPAPRLPKLTDYATIEEVEQLPIKELKSLLTLNRVDYKGCVEREELLERVRRLWLDIQTTKVNRQAPNESNATTAPSALGDKVDELEDLDDLCKICLDAPLDCVLLECGHIATCIECGKQLAECPICRQYVSRVVRTFKA